MKGNKVDAGEWTVTCWSDIRAGIACVLVIAALHAPAAADGPDHDSGLAGLGEPQVLFFADGDWTSGYFTSLGFTQDSKSLVGTLQRNPGSRALFLLGQRVGEVRSFGVTAVDKGADETPKSNLLMMARNIHYEILTTPAGACREPLLLARSDSRLKEIAVVALRATNSGAEETLVGQFPIPRNEKMANHTDCSICPTVTPEATMLVLGTGCSESELEEGHRSVTWWGDVKAWDLRIGEPRFGDAWEGNQVLAVACSADGKLIAAAGGHSAATPASPNRYDGRVVCWEQGFEKIRFDLPLPNHQVHCLAFSPDGKTLVAGGLDGTVKWIDLIEGSVVKSMDVASQSGRTLGRCESLAFSPNGKLLAVGVGSWNRGNKWGETFLIDVRQGMVHKVPSSQENHVITCVAFSPDGKYLATGGMEGVLKLWQINGGE